MRGRLTEPGLGLPPELARRAAHDSKPRSQLRSGRSTWTLHLWGALPSGWCGNLAIHCFGARISIEEGEARRVGAGRWVGAFRLRPQEAGPEAFDFVRMAVRRPVLTLDPQALPLRRVHLIPAPREGLPARLSLEAADELGLLARVLGCFEAAGLQPTQLSLTTRAGVAVDDFHLCGRDGGSPRPAELERLRALLSELSTS